MPSEDSRFRTAREDIVQHRLANFDWDDDWVFDDGRFGLKDGDDDHFLRFLAELLHPLVRQDVREAASISTELNKLLAPDGYKLAATSYLSGRPIYSAVEIDPQPPEQRLAPRHFTEDIRPLVQVLARLAELDGSELEKELLRSAEPLLAEPEFDNWNGGTYYHTLTLTVPIDVFARIGDQVRPLEERVGQRIADVLRAPDDHHISGVVIQPGLVENGRDELTEVVSAGMDRPDPLFWSPGRFRLFISHVSSFKQRATALRQELAKYHITGFVAHETIEPGVLWQKEIEAALQTMDALAALITPDFHASLWTDQEIGWALGSEVAVIPVRRGADPYGFLAQVQGIQGMGKMVPQVADEIFGTLCRLGGTRKSIQEALVTGFENSGSYQAARENIGLLERAPDLPKPLGRRVEIAVRSNYQVSESHGVPDRVAALIDRSTYQPLERTRSHRPTPNS
jgi:hypothetical protein